MGPGSVGARSQGEWVLAVLLPGYSYQDLKFFSLLLAHGSSKNIRPSNDPLHARDQPNIDCWPIGSAKNIRPSSDPLHARDQPNIDCWPRGPAKFADLKMKPQLSC